MSKKIKITINPLLSFMNVLIYLGIAEGQFPLAVTPSTNCTFLAYRELTFATEIIHQLGQRTPLVRFWEIVGEITSLQLAIIILGTTLSIVRQTFFSS